MNYVIKKINRDPTFSRMGLVVELLPRDQEVENLIPARTGHAKPKTLL
jgi:hypothetical protein